MSTPFLENVLFALITGMLITLPFTLLVGYIAALIYHRKHPRTIRTLNIQGLVPYVLVFVASNVIISRVIFELPWWMSIVMGFAVIAGILILLYTFSGREVIANVVSGLSIMVMKHIRTNDTIRIAEKYFGKVEAITLMYTVIRDYENVRVMIPNSEISDHALVNFTYGDHRVCKFVRFTISFDSDVEEAIRIIQAEADKCPELIKPYEPVVKVEVEGYGESSVNLRAWCWTKDVDDALQLEWTMFRTVKQKFDECGIVIPFPHRTVIYRPEKETQESK